MPKNIIFLMTDQHRLDHAGFSGFSRLDTPNLDRIASGTGFVNCQSVNPICTPARTALITGRYTHQIGTLSMSGDLSFQVPTFMQALQKAGYHTSGIGKFHFLQTWNWNQDIGKGVNLVELKDTMKEFGYDTIWETSGKQLATKNYCDYAAHMDSKGLLKDYRDFVLCSGNNSSIANEMDGNDGEPSPFEDADYVDIMTGDKIVQQIKDRPKDKPFYIFGSFCSPHKPMDPPPCYLEQFPEEEDDNFIPGDEPLRPDIKSMLWKLRRSYKAMVKLVDDQIGRVFATLEEEGILDDTVILFTSDHGEMMGDHGRVQKGIWYKESLTVPTAVYHPDHLDGRVSTAPVEITDLSATILDVAGLDPAEALSQGWPSFNSLIPCRSLMPIVSGEADSVRDFTFSECYSQWQCITTETLKYVYDLDRDGPDDVKEHLFDLEADPDELNDVSADPAYADQLAWCRNRRTYIMDTTPAAQTRWAPLMGDDPYRWVVINN